MPLCSVITPRLSLVRICQGGFYENCEPIYNDYIPDSKTHMNCDNVHGYVAEMMFDVWERKLLADEAQQRAPVANIDEFKVSILGVPSGCL